jgi:hypothetical protein
VEKQITKQSVSSIPDERIVFTTGKLAKIPKIGTC